MELAITYEPTGRLCEYARNAKIHTAEQVEQIKESIRQFGFNDPIGVWTNAEGKSEVVEGHGRLIAARELGMEAVPVVHLDSLTDEQRRAYTHVHNQLTMNTGNDEDALTLDLDELGDVFDFENLGFEQLDGLAEDIEEEIKGRIPFAVPVDIRRDYIVLRFENREDFLYASQRLRIEDCDILATGKARSVGTGRVIDGVRALEMMQGD